MKIIIPCAGKSSRFPNMRPKWMLNTPNGNLMLCEAIKGIKFNKEDLIITILRDHENQYSICKGIEQALGYMPSICILENPTKSQSETVYETIKKMKINDSILIKDSDNFFQLDMSDITDNFIAVDDLSNHKEINAANKSYILIDNKQNIKNIVEKQVISSTFSVGGYFFKDSKEFCKCYESIIKNTPDELYISVIISKMIQDGNKFISKFVDNYIDWGTLEDWEKYRKKFKTYFIDIDGVLFRNSAQYFSPHWGETEPLENNVLLIKKLKEKGNQIILVTSRTEEFRKVTEICLKEAEINYDTLLMGCMHTQRVIINDFSKSNPYPSALAINIERDMDDLNKYLKED